MKKLLFIMSAAIVCVIGLAVWVAAQHVPGTGGAVPNAPVSEVGVKYCEDYPSMISCSDPKMQTVGVNGAEIECCTDRQASHGRGATGGNGAKGGRNGSVSKPKPYCEKLIKTTFTDNFGYPKYQDPKNTGIMIPPCDSPFWQNDPNGICCIPSGSDKGGKSNGKGGVKNHAKHHGLKGVAAKSQVANTAVKTPAKTAR